MPENYDNFRWKLLNLKPRSLSQDLHVGGRRTNSWVESQKISNIFFFSACKKGIHKRLLRQVV